MQLAVKGCNIPHPKGSWSLHNFPPLSTTPRQPYVRAKRLGVGFWKPKMFLATFDNLELPKSRAPPLNSFLSFVAPQAWENFEGLWEITFLCENASTNMIFRDLETVFLHQTTEHIRQTCTPDLKLQSGFFQTKEHASSTSNRGWNQNYYSF